MDRNGRKKIALVFLLAVLGTTVAVAQTVEQLEYDLSWHTGLPNGIAFCAILFLWVDVIVHRDFEGVDLQN